MRVQIFSLIAFTWNWGRALGSHEEYSWNPRTNESDSLLAPSIHHHHHHDNNNIRHFVESHETLSKHRFLNNPVGTFRPLILLVRFSDHVNRTLPPRSHFLTLCGSMQRYFWQQSYGKYSIQCNVTDWIDTDNTEAHYAAGIRGFQNSLVGSRFFDPVLTKLDQSGMDWSLYDKDEDGLLDTVLVIHSGFAAEAGSGAACNANAPENRIRSQGWTYSSVFNSWANPSKTIRLYGYAVASAFQSVCDLKSYASMGVMTHEWLHTLGALDLYDQTTGKIGGLGVFDIMASPHGHTVFPGSMSSYSKMLCDWLEPTEITQDGEYEIRSSNRFPDAFIIRRGFPNGEYLLIENRQPILFDAMLPGQKGGLLIYHVDEKKSLQAEHGYPGQPGWPRNGKHYRVALLPADRAYHLERGMNNGDGGDLWSPGMTLGSGDLGTYPNTDSYQDGIIRRTGIEITVLSVVQHTKMTFRVSSVPVKKVKPMDSSKNDESKLFDDERGPPNRGNLGRRLRGVRG